MFKILSVSGGGFMGLYAASVLAGLEEEYGGPLGDYFDLIAGTSVGGIIGLGLASGSSAASIKQAFIEYGPTVFSGSPPKPSKLAAMAEMAMTLFSPKYDSSGLSRIVDEIVGHDLKIGDLRRRIIVPAVNMTKGAPQIFKTAHCPQFRRDYKLFVRDVALATSAAPTFFPLHKIGGELFADGGLYANSPDLLALHEAEHFLKIPSEEIHVLSVGTTTSRFSFSNSAGTNLGIVGWMQEQRLPNVMIASNQALADFMMTHKLGNRYVRVDREQSKEQERSLALDVASPTAIDDLQALGEASLRDLLGLNASQPFFESAAQAPKFFNGGL
ncbi:CBASS cGAMP-activated phospholipase [Maricaulis sp.]|uniref:CBASS cGAMP-activated phospholipase n=1 Tax=Maricaulis sp. TaxID=1486257 RepID=UPI003A917A76